MISFIKLCPFKIINTYKNSINNERLLIRFVSLVLFFGCFVFVSFRSYQCFCKFLRKPKSVDISFHFTGNLPFPSITFCPPIVNTMNPKPYVMDVLKNCGLLFDISTFEGTLQIFRHDKCVTFSHYIVHLNGNMIF